MNETNSTSDVLDFAGEKRELPSGLKTLTILTFIGCGLLLLYTLLAPMLNKFLLGIMDKAAGSGQEMTAKQLEDMQKGRAAIELMQNNLVPILVISIVSLVLCFVGALWMRKLKKDGFWIYSAGEILPVIGNFILLGTKQFTGVTSVIFGVGIPILFIILYARQRKYLVV
ncbi:MAG: hypothetical protein JWR61_4973 [Ferruginibacter sp.]|uniref:hypothetical protein n=1 Tax=Ferruginibacter sp. TaxID=1940288 RepID=UPI0026590A30|nr:hypothetical protein [Ferruginibacter sp.]MDB5280018.1 hypothetical protein [Ferruginibacter sp.]